MARRLSNKILLRKEIGERLRTCLSTEERRRQSNVIASKLYELDTFRTSNRISIYLSTEHEVDTVNILKRMFDDGKKCFIPRYYGDDMDMVSIRSMEDYLNLPMTRWMIKQPDLREERENALDGGGLDMIIVPGVAFTTNGSRLGKGKGYYDRYLKRLRSDNDVRVMEGRAPIKIGLAFGEQIVDDLATESHDESMDIVLHP